MNKLLFITQTSIISREGVCQLDSMEIEEKKFRI